MAIFVDSFNGKSPAKQQKKNIYETLGHKWILLKQHHSHNHQFWWHFLSGLPKIDHAENRLHLKWKSLLVMLLCPILIIGTSYIAKYWCIPNTGLSHNRIHPPNGNFSGDTSSRGGSPQLYRKINSWGCPNITWYITKVIGPLYPIFWRFAKQVLQNINCPSWTVKCIRSIVPSFFWIPVGIFHNVRRCWPRRHQHR